MSGVSATAWGPELSSSTPYGGAINRVGPEATAFVHRDQRFSIQYYTQFGGGRQRRASEAWANGVARALRRHVSGEAYQNYIDPELRGWQQAYYGRNSPGWWT